MSSLFQLIFQLFAKIGCRGKNATKKQSEKEDAKSNFGEGGALLAVNNAAVICGVTTSALAEDGIARNAEGEEGLLDFVAHFNVGFVLMQEMYEFKRKNQIAIKFKMR